MKLIIGLGNPGEEYTQTRHNVGFMVLDALAKKLGAEFKFQKKFNAEIAQTKIGSRKIILAKPQTFMNLSGSAVHTIVDFYKIKIEDITIIHDDKDILFGEVKYQINRSAAGHNGVKSIIEHLGTQNFSRIRIGVAWKNKEKMGDTAKFVLRNFTKTELQNLEKIIQNIIAQLIR